MLKLFADPRIFSYIIMTLYVCNCIRWALERNWPQCWYWAVAFQITLAVTWGLSK